MAGRYQQAPFLGPSGKHGGGTVYLLTFCAILCSPRATSKPSGTWNFTNGVLNSATITATAGNIFVAGLDSADRIYWYSLTGNSWFFAGGAGVSSTVFHQREVVRESWLFVFRYLLGSFRQNIFLCGERIRGKFVRSLHWVRFDSFGKKCFLSSGLRAPSRDWSRRSQSERRFAFVHPVISTDLLPIPHCAPSGRR